MIRAPPRAQERTIRDEAPSWARPSPRARDPSGRFVWHDLMSTDPAAAQAFYGPRFGWAIQDVPMPDFTHPLFRRGEVEVAAEDATFSAGMLQMPPGMEAPSHGLPDAAVDDVDAPPKECNDIPNRGRLAVLGDPQGAPFVAWKSAQPRA